jgi:nucleoside-diphosphate-sugar epimerase
MKKYLVTGGAGFLGRSIVEKLAKNGNHVVILDNQSRGSIQNLAIKTPNIMFINGDIREKKVVEKACKNINVVLHLAYINGTENFYKSPDLVLEVAVKGMINLLDASIKQKVQEFFLASSSEVYSNPELIPTPENVSLIIPDPLNPRYSYSGGKIISELLAIHNSKHFKRTVIFRPHNVYGPAMGFEHVIPQFIMRLEKLKNKGGFDFPIQGDGRQTRSFIYIDDFTSALMLLLNKGNNLEIYNIGTENELSVKELALMIAKKMETKINLVVGPLPHGSPQRRRPDVTKLSELGFSPKVSLEEGLAKTINWYLKQ